MALDYFIIITLLHKFHKIDNKGVQRYILTKINIHVEECEKSQGMVYSSEIYLYQNANLHYEKALTKTFMKLYKILSVLIPDIIIL